MKRIIVSVLVLAMVISLVGCASNRDKGAAIGAGAGAVVGGIIGKAGNTAVGAIIGAMVGGAAGAYIGNYMDKQAEEMRQDLKAPRLNGSARASRLLLRAASSLTLIHPLRPEAKANLDDLARILNKYENTNVLIEGHTDSTGPRDYNMDLSLRRAQSVANQLSYDGVRADRLRIMGYGPDQPIATNETAEGRQLNRRVEIAIFANDKLKKIAEEQVNQ